MKYNSLIYSLLLGIGFLVEHYFHLPIQLLCFIGIVIVVFLIFLLYFYRYSNRKIHIIQILILYLGFFLIGIFLWKSEVDKENKSSVLPLDKLNNTSISAKGIIEEYQSDSNKYNKYIFHSTSILGIPTEERILLYVKKDLGRNFNLNQSISIKSRLLEIPSAKNPYEFDYKEYMKNKAVYYQIFVNDSSDIQIIENYNKKSLSKIFIDFKNDIISKINESTLSPQVKSFTRAFLLGDRSSIDKEQKQQFIDAGIFHILAISGLHIFIFIGILNIIFAPLKLLIKNKNYIHLLIMCILWSYAFFVGGAHSVVRAVTMYSLYILTQILKRKINTLNIWSTTLFLNLLIVPMAIKDIGFILSYVAVLSICLFQPFFRKLYLPRNRVIKIIYDIFTVSISVQILIVPIQLYFFHQLSFLVFGLNILILPFLPIVMFLGLLTIVATYIPWLDFIIEIYNILSNTLLNLIEKSSQLDIFIIKNIFFDAKYLLVSVFIAFSIYYLLEKPSFKKLKYILIGILSLQIMYLIDFYQQKNIRKLTIYNNKEEIISITTGSAINFYTNDNTSQGFKIIRNNILSNELINKVEVSKMNYYFPLKNNSLLIVKNELPIENIPIKSVDMIYLRDTPKIHFIRFLDRLSPKIIITDASCSYYYKEIIKKTCEDRNVIFYDIAESGAFVKAL